MTRGLLILFVLAALVHSGCWAKIDGDKKSLSSIEGDKGNKIEGSGAYDDEEEYDYDEDEYEEGSGSLYKDEEAELIPDDEEGKGINQFPEFGSSNSIKEEKSTSDDIHFDESKEDGSYNDGLLYEYYNEEYEPDYDEEKKKKSKVLYKAESDIVVTASRDNDAETPSPDVFDRVKQILAEARGK